MLVVTEVKVAEVDRDIAQHRVFEWPNTTITCRSAEDRMTPVKVTVEDIRGRRFHIYGKDYVIGWSKQVQNALGIPLEAFESMKEELQKLTYKNVKLANENNTLREELEKLKGLKCNS